ncbi:phospholipase D-like domain-containing protein [Elusimicrobiota bacterium]
MPRPLSILSLFLILQFSSPLLYSVPHISPESSKAVVDQNYLSECTSLIESAKKSIQISHFYFKNEAITKKIKLSIFKALANNVEVSILLEDSIPENKDAVLEFETLGANIRLDGPDKKLHSKFIVVDAEFVLLGSTNFSSKSIGENNETNLLIQSKETAAIYKNYFYSIWDNKAFKFIPKTDSEKRIIPLFGNNYFRSVKKIIEDSKNRIGVILYLAKYYDKNNAKSDSLFKSIIKARKRGVDVSIILEKSSFDKPLNEINRRTSEYLSKHGITVKFDSPDIITHAKLILADNKMVLGSRNWTKSGLEFNIESDVLIDNNQIVNKFWEYFNNLKTNKGD